MLLENKNELNFDFQTSPIKNKNITQISQN